MIFHREFSPHRLKMDTPSIPTIMTLTLALSLTLTSTSTASVLNPPNFNLAEGRRIEATATCGESLSEPDTYCTLVGANKNIETPHMFEDPSCMLLQGQLCCKCDPNNETISHKAEFAIDGSERWWQSPPLSRGLKYNKVNLTIDLGQEFHVAYIWIRMANSPRPGVWVLERSVDNGITYKPWQYFADSDHECLDLFNVDSSAAIKRDNQVICTTEFSKVVPLEGGEMYVKLINDRPSAESFSSSEVLQNFTKATNVRLRFLRTKTLLAQMMQVQTQDPSVTRRYYYSVKDISIGGRCVCNGHADVCDKLDAERNRLLCTCKHNTCGDQCQTCCPGFVQKRWSQSREGRPFQCEPCQCYGHADECLYDAAVDAAKASIDIHGKYEGGGVCQNCRHNTMGNNCDKCRPGYYRPFGVSLNATDVCRPCNCDLTFSTGNCDEETGRCECRKEFDGPGCDRCSRGYYGFPLCQPCDCNYNGTRDEVCQVGGGQCPCKPNYTGLDCDQCAPGFYNFPECKSCECDPDGSFNNNCDANDGQCPCKTNFGTRKCDFCADGYFNFKECKFCDCDPAGTLPGICDKRNGTCTCKPNFSGPRCDECAAGHYDYPNCLSCECDADGALGADCANNGQCFCKQNFVGLACDRCAPGYFNFPECKPCNCDTSGTIGQSISCDDEGQCSCKPTFQGAKCNSCKEGFYNYPVCEECNCDPAGVLSTFAGCGSVKQQGVLCECKPRVEGHICDKCKPLYWNLNINNPQGCAECNCFAPGTIGGLGDCDDKTGQCACKPHVNGRRCQECKDGYYELEDGNLFGCQDCGCDIGGSVSPICDKKTGQCRCRPRITGQKCDQPLTDHFILDLHHQAYECEEGRTPYNFGIRYGADQTVFPGFSWRGYAIMNHVQPEILLDINIEKSNLFKLLFRYIWNSRPTPVKAYIQLRPEDPQYQVQSSEIVFKPTELPSFETVGNLAGALQAFVLDQGRWVMSIRTEGFDVRERNVHLLLDKVVLIPQPYYEPGVLQTFITEPCHVDQPQDADCIKYQYPDITAFPAVKGIDSYVIEGQEQTRPRIVTENCVNGRLGCEGLVVMDDEQNAITLNLRVSSPGDYVLVLRYFTPRADASKSQEIDVSVRDSSGGTGGGDGSGGANVVASGHVVVYGCDYASLCNEVVTDDRGRVLFVPLDGDKNQVTLTSRPGSKVLIDSVVAVPASSWNTNIILPKVECTLRDGNCVPSVYPIPPESFKVEVEDGNATEVTDGGLPEGVKQTGLVRLDNSTPSVLISGQVAAPGPYVFVVQYYQPLKPVVFPQVQISSGSQRYPGKISATFCPHTSGCRTVITYPGGGSDTFQLTDVNYQILIHSVDTVWLDYVFVVPAISYNEKILGPLPVDKASEFIQFCAGDNFNIRSESGGFCQDSTFTITTEYNNGARPCECNIDGSKSFQCQKYGGQCDCKDHVIGRTCSQCKTGFYGFPNCKPCNCAYGLCDPSDGKCICGPNVVKDDACDTCMPQHFGFDPLIGCEPCNCNREGILNGNYDCASETGQCRCRPNVGGRRCDECLPGFFNFPECRPCACDERGVRGNICDARTGECICKENVVGPRCDSCAYGHYYLEKRNPQGCTKCFCFGHVDECASTQFLTRAVFTDLSGWNLDNFRQGRIENTPDRQLVVNMGGRPTDDPSRPAYWVAPSSYLGNRVTAFGGELRYRVNFKVPAGQRDSTQLEADVILSGNNLTIAHTSIVRPEPGRPTDVKIDMLPTGFVHFHERGGSVSREQFMMVLADLSSLKIRASYTQLTSESRLSNVQIDIAERNTISANAIALNVEECRCPPNYVGTSCEDCAEGFYRAMAPPYLGVCIPCQCNGRADRCDPVTGNCIDCRGNTAGDHCERCESGHYGNPMTGESCRICPCPQARPGFNFAESCQQPDRYRPSGFVCACLPGFDGPTCERCKSGFFGDPMTGVRCQPCGCNGLIDPSDPDACDRRTGECLKCRGNAVGPVCGECLPWHWGNPLQNRPCTPCTCSRLGSRDCARDSGRCTCHANVVGPNCDRCAPDHWGFNSGRGCTPCGCGNGAVSSQCDMETGQCRCLPGVGGKNCDRCDHGHWNFGPSGCQKCSCDHLGSGGRCDPVTGRCQCLPGVTGPRCDRCEERWVLVENVGCKQCDKCVHILLDDMDAMISNTSGLLASVENIGLGRAAYNRLDVINRTAHDLAPQIDSLLNLDISRDLEPLELEIQGLKAQADRTEGRALRAASGANKTLETTSGLLERAQQAEQLMLENIRKITDGITAIQEVIRRLQGGGVGDTASLLRQARLLLEDIQKRDFSRENAMAEDELRAAKELYARVKDFHDRAMDHWNQNLGLQSRRQALQDGLAESRNLSARAEQMCRRSQDIIGRVQNHPAKALIDQINEEEKLAKEKLEEAERLIKEAQENVKDARKAYKDAERETSRLDDAAFKLRRYKEEMEAEEASLKVEVRKAMDHALSLQRQAEDLDRMFVGTRDFAANATAAATAYQRIANATNEAMAAAQEALAKANQAYTMTNGLSGRAGESAQRSATLLSRAKDLKLRVDESFWKELELAKTKVKEAMEGNDEVESRLALITGDINGLPNVDQDRLNRMYDRATGAQKKANAAVDSITDVMMQIPGLQQQVDGIKETGGAPVGTLDGVRDQVENVKELVPKVKTLMERLTLRMEKISQKARLIEPNITALKEKINLAREISNKIKVGMTFERKTTLQLRTMSNLQSMASRSKIDISFKTTSKDGLLLYLGPDGTKIEGKEDWLSLELANGKVVYKYDLGSGPANIVCCDGHDFADGEWHQITAERSEQSGTLMVLSRDVKPQTSTGESPGASRVLDLPQQTTKLYVGGIPATSIIPGYIANRRYEGCIERIQFWHYPVGLWNFIEGDNLAPCQEGDFPEQTSDSVQFKGDGYIILNSRRFQPRRRSEVVLRFRTYAEDGLLFFVGNDRDFMSLSMANGTLWYQYDLGSGVATLSPKSGKKLNDGEWHSVKFKRKGKSGILHVDGNLEDTGMSPGNMEQLSIRDEVLIGGVKRDHLRSEVTKKGFHGCIQGVTLGTAQRELKDNEEARGVIEGCSFSAVSTVTFKKFGKYGYIIMVPPKDFNNFDFSFKFRTVDENGLIVYSANEQQDQSLAIGLVDGQLQVVLVPARGSSIAVDTTSSEVARKGFHDGYWHHVAVSLRKKKLILTFNDNITESIEVDLRQKPKIKTTALYFGGVPESYRLNSDNVPTTERFKGCLADVRMDTKFLDFAAGPPESRVNVGLDQCLIGPELPPEPGTTVTIAPPTPSPGAVGDNAMFGDIDPHLGPEEASPSSSSSLANHVTPDVTNYIVAPAIAESSSSSSPRKLGPSSSSPVSLINIPFLTNVSLSNQIPSSTSVTPTLNGMTVKTEAPPVILVEVPSKAPTNVIVADGAAEGEAAVSWSYIIGAGEIVTGYRVAYAIDVGSGVIDDSSWTYLNVNGGDVYSQIISKLLAGSSYVFRVTAVNGVGIGPWSQFVRWQLRGPDGVKCALPKIPASAASGAGGSSAVAGFTFGGVPDSRLEFAKVPGKIRQKHDFTFDFQTSAPEGLLFFVAGVRQTDFISVYMQNGVLFYGFNCGSGALVLSSQRPYNDGQWHALRIQRDGGFGELFIDGESLDSGTAPGSSKSMNIKEPYYFGGISQEVKEGKQRRKFMRNVGSVSSGFVGCMRDFKQSGRRLDNKDPPEEIGTSLCSGDTEDGTFFGSNGGYIKLLPSYRVGLDLIIKFAMKPRTMDGVILAIQSARNPDFLMLQMQDGNLIFSANNGAGEILTKYEPEAKNYLCDGNWHEIMAVKAKNVVTLTVDDEFQNPGIGKAGISSTDTNDPFYVGGVPDGASFSALRTTEKFVGCVRNFRFENKTKPLSAGDSFGDVNIGSCPTT